MRGKKRKNFYFLKTRTFQYVFMCVENGICVILSVCVKKKNMAHNSRGRIDFIYRITIKCSIYFFYQGRFNFSMRKKREKMQTAFCLRRLRDGIFIAIVLSARRLLLRMIPNQLTLCRLKMFRHKMLHSWKQRR